MVRANPGISKERGPVAIPSKGGGGAGGGGGGGGGNLLREICIRSEVNKICSGSGPPGPPPPPPLDLPLNGQSSSPFHDPEEGNYPFTGVVSFTPSFHPQKDITNEEKG